LTTAHRFLYLGIAGPKEGLVKSAKRQFDPHAFLAKVGTGKTISKYRKGRIIYAQGEEADRIFYIQSGKVKVTVVFEQGKEAVVGILETAQFFLARDV
jgi:CRP/FNR family cyclic AMP-dependent transcriptional regulator